MTSAGMMFAMFSVVYEPESSVASPGAGDDLRLVDTAGRTVATCRLWWRDTATLDGKRCGYIGGIDADDAEVFGALMNHAASYLEENGCQLAVAPIDGDTWHAYRWVTSSHNRPVFFLEPNNPAKWIDWISNAGFEPIAEYVSARVDDLTQLDPRLLRVEQRLGQRGLKIRPIDLASFNNELIALHALCLDAFQYNFLYTPIEQDAFVSMYLPLRDKLHADLCLLAECEGELVGFVFGVPDFAQAQRGEAIDTVIIKTLAVRPGRDWAGLGGLLMEKCQLTAHNLGFTSAIHALMHASNQSTSLSSHYGKVFRRYALFARAI